jgi:hypothetical protein
MNDADDELITHTFTGHFESMVGYIPESVRFIRGAHIFASYARALEDGPPERYNFEEHHNTAIAAYIFGWFALEALVNEVHFLANDSKSGVYRFPLTDAQRALLRSDYFSEKNDVLQKYVLLVNALGGAPYDAGSKLHQEVVLLRTVRNLLAHYRMNAVELIRDGVAVDAKEGVLARLRGRFELRPAHFGPPVFPDAIATADGARWAYHAARTFIADFHKRTGIPLLNDLPPALE